jgi:hypothetical protein
MPVKKEFPSVTSTAYLSGLMSDIAGFTNKISRNPADVNEIPSSPSGLPSPPQERGRFVSLRISYLPTILQVRSPTGIRSPPPIHVTPSRYQM